MSRDLKANHRGAVEGPVSKKSPSTVSLSGKFFMATESADNRNESAETQWRLDIEGERREQERKHKALLEEWGVTEQEIEGWREQDEVDGREAAYGELVDDELCLKLIGKLAPESAVETGDAIGEVRDRYDRVVMELLAARYTNSDGKRYSLGSVLLSKYETDAALSEFVPNFGKWIGKYVSDCIREHSFGFTPLYRQIVPAHTWTLCDHTVDGELLTALAEEYVRDRAGLMRFLFSVFKQWRKVYDPQSLWRVRLLTQQHLGGPKVVAQYVENAGAVSPKTTPQQVDALRQCIKQYRSRDRKDALKRQKAR
jgi:hypothetical protein